MAEAWTYIDGMKFSVPLDSADAIKYGWYRGAELRRWRPHVDTTAAAKRDNEIIEWCGETFGRSTYKVFYDSVWFHREKDAVLCLLKWA